MFFGRSSQLLRNKSFDLRSRFRRQGGDREGWKKMKKNFEKARGLSTVSGCNADTFATISKEDLKHVHIMLYYIKPDEILITPLSNCNHATVSE